MCSYNDSIHLFESSHVATSKENIAMNKPVVSPVVQRAIESKLPAKSYDTRAPEAQPVRERETLNELLRRTMPR